MVRDDVELDKVLDELLGLDDQSYQLPAFEPSTLDFPHAKLFEIVALPLLPALPVYVAADGGSSSEYTSQYCC